MCRKTSKRLLPLRRRKMEAVYASLSEKEKAIVIMQGTPTSMAMIAEHKRQIDAGGRSVLLEWTAWPKAPI